MAEETVAVRPPVDVAVEEPEPQTIVDALRVVIRKSLESNGLVRGLSEVARALDRKTAHLCILADDCEDEGYKNLISALCKTNGIDLIHVESREELAKWAGLAKVVDGEVKKVHKCSSVVIRDYGEKTRSLDYLVKNLH